METDEILINVVKTLAIFGFLWLVFIYFVEILTKYPLEYERDCNICIQEPYLSLISIFVLLIFVLIIMIFFLLLEDNKPKMERMIK